MRFQLVEPLFDSGARSPTKRMESVLRARRLLRDHAKMR